MKDSEQGHDDAQQPADENRLIAERRAKLSALRQQGQAFPNDFRRTAEAAVLQTEFKDVSKEELEGANREFAVAGRFFAHPGWVIDPAALHQPQRPG